MEREVDRARTRAASAEGVAEQSRQESLSAREFAGRWRDEVREVRRELQQLEEQYRNDAQARGSQITELRKDIDQKLSADGAEDVAARLLDIRQWRDRLRDMNVRAERIEIRLRQIEESFGFVEESPAPPWIKLKPGRSTDRPPKTRE